MTRIYRDVVLGHDDHESSGELTTNSKPSINYWMMHQLRLAAGDRVLEIGAGGGWLVAMIGHIVGAEGAALGVEVDEDLVAFARHNVRRNNVDNVTIAHSNGLGDIPGTDPFDRIVVTTSIPHVPYSLVERLVDGGLLIAPIAMRTGGDFLFVFEKKRSHLESRAYLPGVFVPARDLSGTNLVKRGGAVALDDITVCRDAVPAEILREPVLDRLEGGEISRQMSFSAFRWFLAIYDSAFTDFRSGDSRRFGLLDHDPAGVATYDGEWIAGYGDRGAFERLRDAFHTWCSLGMPAYSAYHLAIRRAGHGRLDDRRSIAVERSGDAELAWSVS